MSEALVIAIRHCPLLVRLQVGGVFLALVMSAWISLVAANDSTLVTPVVLPPSTEVVWEDRVGSFAARMQTAFGIDEPTARRYAEWTLDAAARHHIQPELLASLIYVESTFDANARSDRGAVGPAQVIPSVWASVCQGDLGNPADNIDCGARILAAYADDCGDISCALAFYNAGPTAARGAGAGRRYVARVDSHADLLERAVD